MGTLSLAPAGQLGIVSDINPAELPPSAWSQGNNVWFNNGAAIPALDSSPIYTGSPTPLVWALPTMQTAVGTSCWMLTSTTKMYAFVTGVLTDITRVSGDYTGASTNRWNGDVLSGVTIANNGVDKPQAWLSPDPTVKAIDLANWPALHRAACIRSFKSYLLALNVTKDGTRYQTLVKWSHPADPGTVPVTWDETDPTKDAGEWPLSETAGSVVDCLPLGNDNMVYKTDSVYRMSYIGGTFVFSFRKIFGDFGVPSQDCVVEFQDKKHFVFTGDDLIVHDGQNASSVATSKIQKLLKNLSSNQILSAFVTLNPALKEVWLCYRVGSIDVRTANRAITWSYVDGTIGLRDLPEYSYITSGRLDTSVTGVLTWANVTGTWAEMNQEWGTALAAPSSIRMLGMTGTQIDWVASSSFCSSPTLLERTYLGVPMKAGQAPDLSTQKFMDRFWPRFTGKKGTVVNLTIGGADSVDQPIQWKTPKQYIIGQTKHVDQTITAKMFALRIESEGTAVWNFNGIDARIIPVGDV